VAVFVLEPSLAAVLVGRVAPLGHDAVEIAVAGDA
jgi:hypothetical protein